ncbi:MAG: type II secretion system F family protein [Firmicutes bacterium]|nr:type II secretion system F family protein [Bacillota bacterium]
MYYLYVFLLKKEIRGKGDVMEFEYKAIAADGKVVSGKSEAKTRSDMIQMIKEQGLSLLDLNEIVKEKHQAKSKGIEIGFEMSISNKQLMFFTRQLASLLRAGIPILRCLDMLHEQTVSRKLKKVIKEISGSMQQGKSFSNSMQPHNPPFNDMFVSMVRVGESTGDLSKSVGNLATSLENQHQIKQKIKSALSYPLFIIAFCSALVYAMVTFLLPTFTPLFDDSGLDIKNDYPITQFLIDVSNFASQKWVLPAFFGALIVIWLVFKVILNNPKGRLIFDRLLFYAPFFQSFVQMQQFAQVADLMSSLLKSGMVLVDSLELTAVSAGNMVIKNALLDTSERIKKGSKLSTALIENGTFSQMLVQMVSVGEDTGNLSEMFERTSEYYRQELDSALAALTSLIEPAMMIFVGIMVLFMVLGIFMPIMGISQAYGK